MVLKETLWKGFRNRAIFKAMATEELVSVNTPVYQDNSLDCKTEGIK